MKTLFVKHPRNKISIYGDSNLEPLEFEIIAAPLKGQHDVSILDMRLEGRYSLDGTLQKIKPDIVGFTGYTVDVYSILKMAEAVRNYNPDIKIAVGGIHASLLPQDFYHPAIDFVIIGDGEITFRELLAALEKGGNLANIPGMAVNSKDGQVITPRRPIPKDLSGFPVPDRSLTKKYRPHYYSSIYRPAATMITSRGCPFKCKFCSIWKFMEGKYLARDVKSVADELELIEEPYISFIDDNLTSNFKHFGALYEEIRRRGIRKEYRAFGRTDAIARRPDLIEKWSGIGLKEVSLGMESINDADLRLLNKQNTIENNLNAVKILKENGVKIKAFFIVNQDFERRNFNELFEFIEKMEIEHPNFTILTPLPETDLHEKLKSRIIIHHYEFYDLAHSVLPTRLPRQEFYDQFVGLYSRFYSPRRFAAHIFQRVMSRFGSNYGNVPPPLPIHKILFWSVGTAIFSKRRYKQELHFISKSNEN